MRKVILLGLLAAVGLSACAGAVASDADPADAVSILVYKSPT
jgi:hypothetical protein